MPARKFLVFATEIFHFEVEIGPPCSAPDGRSAQLSHLRVFQTLGSDGTASMAVACPEKSVFIILWLASMHEALSRADTL